MLDYEYKLKMIQKVLNEIKEITGIEIALCSADGSYIAGTMQLPDVLETAMSSFYIAYILHLKYNDDIKELNVKKKVGLVLSTIVISLCKIVYVPLCLLLFLIPKEKFGTLRKTIC